MSEAPSKSDLELFFSVENSPKGTWRMFTADQSGVQAYINQHFENYGDIKRRIKNALQSQCFIEVISLRLQVIDYWLRIFIENSAPGIKRKKEFGHLIKQAKDHGLPEYIYNKLTSFNNARVSAIHGFAIGTTSYEKIEEEAQKSQEILIETITYIVNNSGKIVYNREQLCASPGALTMNVKAYCKDLLERCEY